MSKNNKNIALNSLPDKLKYVQGEAFDSTGMIVVEKYDSGATVEIILSNEPVVIGDVNGDGNISMIDATEIQKHL